MTRLLNIMCWGSLAVLLCLSTPVSAQSSSNWQPDPVPAAWADTILRSRMLGPYTPPPPPRSARERNAEREDAARQEAPKPVAEPQAPPDPDESLRLVGLVQVGEGGVVLIEDMNAGLTQKLQIGEAFSAGRLASVEGTTLIYVVDDEPRRLQLGQTLSGKQAPTPGPLAASSAASGAETASESGGSSRDSGSAAASGDDERRAALLRLMRERRASE